jgi:hypothetical protein
MPSLESPNCSSASVLPVAAYASGPLGLLDWLQDAEPWTSFGSQGPRDQTCGGAGDHRCVSFVDAPKFQVAARVGFPIVHLLDAYWMSASSFRGLP